ncbi:MAG TPA: glycosyltransferase family 39 protein [Acidobacteriaceae bacterium]|nr:glycosyltransferase family 39 protein [Acidobacteriaceae bacterium]
MHAPSVRTSDRLNRYLLVALATAFLLRAFMVAILLYTSGVPGVSSPDAPEYLAPMHDMLRGSFSTPNGPELKRTPGYPIFLMLTGMAGNHPLLAVTCQVLLACFSVFLVYRIGTLLFQNGWVAVLGAGLYAIEPISIFYSVLLFAEALFTALILLFLYQVIRYLCTASWSPLLWAALALSASVYVKPIAYYLPVLCVLGFMVVPTSVRVPARLARAGAFLALCTILIGAWQVRNYVETGYSGFTSLSDTQLYTYNAAGVLAHREHLDFFAERDKLDHAAHPEQANWTIAQRLAFQKHEALRIIGQNRMLYAELHLRGMVTALLDPAGTDILRHLGLYPTIGGLESMVVNQGIIKTMWWVLVHKPLVSILTIVIGLITAAYYLLAILGMESASKQREIFIVLLLIAFYFILVAGGPAGMGRYRYPIMPIVALFAGAGLSRFIRSPRWEHALRRKSTDTVR